ncbi:MAG: hypothetical protein RL341_2134 [Pseudomonadota bacterium]
MAETTAPAKGPDQKYCSECGAIIRLKAEICPQCGVRQQLPAAPGAAGAFAAAPGSRKSRTVAIVLALLLGGLGMHKFYLGQTGMGALYLVFCWTFIPAILGLIEGLIMLTMSDEAFARKYP